MGNPGDLLSHNLFAYCKNNPVNNYDPDGYIVANIIGAVIGAGLGGLLGSLVANHYGLKGWKRNLVIAGFAVGSGVVGWFAGPLVAKLAQQVLASIGATLTYLGQLAFTSWKDAENYLQKVYGGVQQVFFRTSLGGRYIDVLANDVAHESKVGYVTLTGNILLQIQKDGELLQRGAIKDCIWHFFGSEVTGKIGASANVLAELAKYGIKYVIGK